MTDYDKQAADFLAKTGATITARFVKTGIHFIDEKPGNERDIWQVKLKRGSREYVFNFGDSINSTEARIKKIAGNSAPFRPDEWRTNQERIISNYTSRSYGQPQVKNLQLWEKQATSEYKQAGEDYRPTAYSILAALQNYEPADNVDDFADEFGYTKPSEALRVFKAVHKEWNAIKQLFTDEEIEALREIC